MTLPFPAPTDMAPPPKAPNGGHEKKVDRIREPERGESRFRDLLDRTDRHPAPEKPADSSDKPETTGIMDEATHGAGEDSGDEDVVVVVIREGEGEIWDGELVLPDTENQEIAEIAPLPVGEEGEGEPLVETEQEEVVSVLPESPPRDLPEEDLVEEAPSGNESAEQVAEAPEVNAIPVPAPGAESVTRPTGSRTSSSVTVPTSSAQTISRAGTGSMAPSATFAPAQPTRPISSSPVNARPAPAPLSPFVPGEGLAGNLREAPLQVMGSNPSSSLPFFDTIPARSGLSGNASSSAAPLPATGTGGGEPLSSPTAQSHAQSRSSARAETQPTPAQGRPDTQFIFQKVAEGTERLRSDGRSKMELQVQLRDGTELKIRLQIQAGQLQATIRTDSHELRQSLQQSLPQLFSRLDQQGIGSVDVQLEYGDPSSETGSKTAQSEEDELATLTHRYIVKESGPESAMNQPGAERISAPSVYSKTISKRIALHTWA